MTARELPSLAAPGAFFWTGGADGELVIGWCADCAHYLHPAQALCPDCFGAVGGRAIPGMATIVSCTENRQPWLPGHPPPYVIAIVELEAAPHVRLTTNIVGGAAAVVRIGQRVQVQFEQHEDVWLPCFTPVPELPVKVVDDPLPARRPRAPAGPRGAKFEARVAITGIGQSAIGRRLERAVLPLTIDACRAAIADAGLTPEDIDGLAAYPGSDGLPGVSQGGVRAVEQILGVQPVWHCGAPEVPGQLGGVHLAMLAVAAGLCRHVLCFTSFTQAGRPASRVQLLTGRITGELRWQLPFGAATPVHWIGLTAAHYLHRYGLDRSVFAGVAIAARQHAACNPNALYTTPLTVDEHAQARIVSTPFGLYDCDVPCDGAMAVIVSARETARDLRQPPVYVEAAGTQITEHQSWDQGSLTHQRNVFGPAAHLWTRTDLTPAEVDVACLYDGFTFNVFSWLEALGFCAPGEAADFIAGGVRIGPGGELPINPHGGQLAAGRSNGHGHLLEAVAQLRGQGAARQVANARVAVVSAGGGIPAGCFLLHND